jgi:outer membrane receptor protein involved in Fe transport
MKKILVCVILSLLLILPAALFAAETGTIAGKVTIKKTDAPLQAANVLIEDTKTGILTLKNGSFIIKNVPVGIHTVTASFIGYEKQSQEVEVKPGLTTTIRFTLVMKPIGIPGITVTATRAVERETPIAFTNVGEEEISDKYTTEDMPQLLVGVPGVFSTTAGLGEGNLMVRGFDADKVQILLNGIPVNDPESQQTYWSDWTGLSSTVKSVQVQRGAGCSLYGSGAFGGSVNIETMGATIPGKQWTFRTSVGSYYTDDKVANGKGGMETYNPINYIASLRYNSGNLYGGKLNYSAMFERKIGDSYQPGTGYDGYSLGIEAQNIWGAHTVNTSFISAPQKHNQARVTTDMALQDKLGRNYNRNNHKYQENYYNKPQLSFRDEWKVSDNQLIMTNVFYTQGDGGGKYLKNEVFDVETGEDTYLSTSEYTDNKYFGRHAYHIYQTTGLILDGIEEHWDSTGTVLDSVTFNGEKITYGANLPNYDYSHSWQNDGQSHNKQFGINTYYDYKLSKMLDVIVGGDFRRWVGYHFARSWNFRYTGGTYAQAQDRYSYHTTVTNLSGFLRTTVKPIEKLNIMFDGQYASYTSKVEEDPIEIFDYQQGNFTGKYYYATKDMKNDDGSLKFTEDDYEKTYDFFSPKIGANYNLTDYINLIANYSIAYKEPRVGDWYSRSGGPNAGQTYTDSLGEHFYGELNPEKTTTMEFGLGYESTIFDAKANYYTTDYEDKIESSLLESGDYLTINAGKARHQGLELAANANIGNFDASVSGSYAHNRWTKMKVKKIFGVADTLVVDKVVPYSPEQMASGSIGYTFKNLPLDGKLRIGFSGNWWDEYYGSYTNKYKLIDGTEVDAKLPYYLAINSNIRYAFKLGGKNASLRLDLNNINNRKDNYSSAYYSTDYGRSDILNGRYYMYVNPAPLFNVFTTVEIRF